MFKTASCETFYYRGFFEAVLFLISAFSSLNFEKLVCVVIECCLFEFPSELHRSNAEFTMYSRADLRRKSFCTRLSS